jgi:hypothetical protein
MHRGPEKAAAGFLGVSTTYKFLVLILLAFALRLQSGIAEDEGDSDIPSQIYDKYLVILCAERDFDAARREAERVSTDSGVQFSMNGRIWDANRGLILPDVCDDPSYCGEYVPRRHNELHLIINPVGYISVEKSEAYPHLLKGNYIALAAICDSNEEAEQELGRFRPFAPKAYVAKIEIYMGCIH